MNKIVLAGASVYGLNNISDDSMLKVFSDELHRLDPRIEIILLTRHPNAAYDIEFQVKSIPNLDHQRREDSAGRWFNGLNPKDDPENMRGITKAIKDADLLVMGGDPFIDITLGFYRGIIPYTVLLLTLAKFMNTKFMINGVHMGRALQTKIGLEQSKYCVSNADCITIREEHTRFLFKEMGYWPLPNVHTLSDASYGLKPIKEKSRGIEILRKENIRFPKGGLMGVTFRHMYWKWGADEWSKYSTMVARICDDVFERKGLSILFIPHNTYEKDTKYMDDRPGHSEIVAKMKHKNVAHQIKSRLSVDDTLALFPLLDITFSNRRHTAMFAALHDVVGMGVGEINHVKPPMEQLGINPDKFVSEEDFDYKLMRDNLFSIWDDKAIIKLRIKDKLPALRQKALDNSKFALNLLQ